MLVVVVVALAEVFSMRSFDSGGGGGSSGMLGGSGGVLLGVSAQWFSDPCSYHPHVLPQLRARFASIVGQSYATDAIEAHIQHHLEAYEQAQMRARAGGADEDPGSMGQGILNKPLVLSFHGPTGTEDALATLLARGCTRFHGRLLTLSSPLPVLPLGTGKSLTANSISTALFHKPASSHVHTYHGSDFSGSTPAQVASSILFLKREFAAHVRRCPLALFIIEEIHLMAPGVLDGLRHLMDAQAPNSRIKIEEASSEEEREEEAKLEGKHGAQTGANARSSGAEHIDGSRSRSGSAHSHSAGGPSRKRDAPPSSQSIAINFSHVIWLFTTNIGSQQVQKVAYDAAKSGLSRESLSPSALHEMLLASLAHSEQLQLLRDSSVLSALIPFFPLFKMHVKECAAVQLGFRRKFWIHQKQVAEFRWDSSVLNYAAGQLKYQGPISIYGCKNIHEILTHVLLSHLTRTFRRLDEEEAAKQEEVMRDGRISAGRKMLSYGAHLWHRATQIFTGPQWNYAHTNVSVSVVPATGAATGSGEEEIVFELVSPPTPQARGSRSPPLPPVRTEIRKSLHAYAHSAAYHEVHQSSKPSRHEHMRDDATDEGEEGDDAEAETQQGDKDEL